MKIVLDTNVLFSAVYRIGSVPYKVFLHAMTPPNKCLICIESINELRENFTEKIPKRASDVEVFIDYLEANIDIIPVPNKIHPDEAKITDTDDSLIFRAAVAAGADMIISNDRHLLNSGIKNPIIISIDKFYDNYVIIADK